MKKLALMLAALGLAFSVFAEINWDKALVRGTTPNGKIFYAPGEEMTFSLILEGVTNDVPEGAYFLDWERRGDDGLTEKGRAPLPLKAPFVYRTKSDRPGFVCLEANVVTPDGKRVPKNHPHEKLVFFMGGAGVCPEKVRGAPEPADYDAFWDAQMKALDAVPVTAERREVPCEDKLVKLYAVRIACAGARPVTGYLTIPVAASATNRMPIRACYNGAAWGREMKAPTKAPHDWIEMHVNVNGYELGRGEDYIKKFFKALGAYGMDHESNANPETSYWKDVALRAVRYLQWITTLPEWDGETLEVRGGSQGGWQAIMAASRFHKVTRLVTNGTWGCDWRGQDTLGRLKSTYRPKTDAPALAYFDPVFAAARVTCPVAIQFAGLGDYVSPPSSLTALYNALKVPKKIVYVQGETHGWRPGGDQKLAVDGGYDRAVKAQSAGLDPAAFIAAALQAGQKEIKVPKGVYDVGPGKVASVYLKGARDVTIDFQGGELRGRTRSALLTLRDCTGVTVRNVTLDYPHNLPFTQGVIERVGPDGEWDVRIAKGYPDPANGVWGWPVQAYDAQTGDLVNPMRYLDGIKVERTAPGRYRVTGGKDRRGKVGDVAVWTLPCETFGDTQSADTRAHAVYLRNCGGCRMENVTVYSTPGSNGFRELMGEGGNAYVSCHVVPRPPETDPVRREVRRFRSGDHDAFNSRAVRKGPTLRDCTARNHCDDDLNIHGAYQFIASATGATVRAFAKDTYATLLRPGDRVQLVTKDGYSPDALLRVVSVKPAVATEAERSLCKGGLVGEIAKACNTLLEVVFDRADPVLRPGSLFVSMDAAGSGFRVENCRFGPNRARGFICNASYGEVVGCTFDRLEDSAVLSRPSYTWLEGGASRDVRFRDCTFIGCGVFFAVHREMMTTNECHRNISFVDCTFKGPRARLEVQCCTGLELRGNTFDLPPDKAVKLVKVADVTRE